MKVCLPYVLRSSLLSDKFHFAYMAFQSNEMILVVSFEQTMTHDSQFPADRSAQAH